MSWQLSVAPRETLVICSIDTEEDNWLPCRDKLSAENVRHLPMLEQFLERLGVPATYFTSYGAANDPTAASILREISETGRSEIAAHLHPWNTPPTPEPLTPPHFMMGNLAAGQQSAKLRTLTQSLEKIMGRQPTAFRAGKLGMGSVTASVLVANGYRVDSSVAPFVDLRETHGPDYRAAPLQPYCIRDGSPTVAFANGALLEIPLSVGFSREPFGVWSRGQAWFDSRVGRKLRIGAVASRLGIMRRIRLSPEVESVADMLELSGRLTARGVSHLQLVWHSPSLLPGATPFVRTLNERAALLSRIATFLESLASRVNVRFVTISDAAAALASWQP